MNEKILMGGTDLPLVWTAENLRAAGLSGSAVTKEDILAFPERYRDTRYLFSTWGMPAFREDEIRRCLPSLRAVFYAAGSVQSFAAPFLDAGVAVFSAPGGKCGSGCGIHRGADSAGEQGLFPHLPQSGTRNRLDIRPRTVKTVSGQLRGNGRHHRVRADRASCHRTSAA